MLRSVRLRCAVLLVLGALFLSPSALAQSVGDWLPGFTVRGLDGPVYVAKEGPDGKIYVGGAFTTVDGREHPGIARWNPLRQAWEEMPGLFSGGVALRGAASGEAPVVHDLDFLPDGRLVMAGRLGINTSNGWRTYGVVLYDGAAWDNPGNSASDAAIESGKTAYTVAVDGTDLVVGGDFATTYRYNAFTAMRGVARVRVADGVWTALGDSGAPGTNGVGDGSGGAGVVHDLLLDIDGSLVVAGAFGAVGQASGSLPLRGVARFDFAGQTWSAFGDAVAGQNGADAVYQILRSGTDYFARVESTAYQSDGAALALGTAARWDGGAWHALGSTRPGGASSGYNGVSAATGLFLTPDGQPVYVGAERAFVSGTTGTGTRGFARWTGSAWVPHFGGDAGIQVYAEEIEDGVSTRRGHEPVVVAGGETFAFGPFYTVTNGDFSEDVARAAAWNGSAWRALGEAQSGGIASSGNRLYSAQIGRFVYVAGEITRAGLQPVQGFARYNTTAREWDALPAIDGVRGIVAWGSKLVLWGTFQQVQQGDGRTVNASRIVAFDPATRQWEALGDGTTASRNGLSSGTPNDVAVLPGGDLAVVGNMRGAQRDGSEVELLDVGVWNAVAGAWQPLEAGGVAGEAYVGSNGFNANAGFEAVTTTAAGEVIVVGTFRSISQPDGTFLNTHGIARWDGTIWRPVGRGFYYANSQRYYDVEAIGGEIYVGGRFEDPLDPNTGARISADNLVRWTGTTWERLGSSSRTVHEIEVYGGEVFARTPDRVLRCGTGFCMDVDGTVTGGRGSVEALSAVGQRLYAVGSFANAPDETIAQGFAALEAGAPQRLPLLAITEPSSGARGIDFGGARVAWTPLTGADVSYTVQVDTDSGFGAPRSQTTTTPEATFPGLTAGTEYHARVRAIVGGVEGPWSAASRFTTAFDQPPGTTTLVAPADGEVSAPLDATLSWSEAPFGETYAVQVATDAGFAALVADVPGVAGTAYTLSGLTLGTTYHWRVRAVNGIGAGAWSAPRSFETAGADYSQPSVFSASATVLAHNTGQSGFTPAPRANVQIARDAAFTDVVIDSTYTPGNVYYNFFTYTLSDPGTEHWARVRGISDAGLGGAWSDVRSFRTSGVNPNAPTGSVATVYPARFERDVSLTPTLTWDASGVTGTVTGFDVQVSRSSIFSGTVVSVTDVPGSSFDVTEALVSSSTHYWRVRARNGVHTGNWSASTQFNTRSGGSSGGGDTLPAPVLVSPANNASNQPQRVTFEWEEVEGAAYYVLQASLTYNFGSGTEQAVVDSTSASLLLRTGSGGYRWRVAARASDNSQGAWSDVRFLTVSNTLPDGPTFLSPTNGGDLLFTGDIGVRQAYITWEPVEGATHYELDGDVTSGSGGSTAEPWYTSGAVFFGAVGLDQIRVRAVTNGGRTAWSTWYYDVEPTDDLHPFPIADGVSHATREVALSPLLVWDGSGYATSTIQIATDAAFTSVVFSATDVPHQAQVTGLMPNTRYYWRLRGGADKPWSGTLVFDTGDGVPTARLALIAPGNTAQQTNVRPELRFGGSFQAERYRVQIASGPDFSAAALDTVVTTTRFRPDRALMGGTTYRWRVQAVGTNGGGPWSDVWTFTPRPALPQPPTLLRPEVGSTDAPLLVTLQWNRTLGATSFQAQVATDATFTEIIADRTTTEPYARLGSLLMPGTPYYVRLRAYSTRQNAWGAWSDAQAFTTRTLPALAAPALTGPAEAAAAVPLLPTLAWDAVAGAARYEVQVAADAAFTTPAKTRTDAQTLTLYDAPPSTTRYWRVRALALDRGPEPDDSAIGAGPWSAVRSFTTSSGPAPSVAPVLANDHAVGNASRRPTFRWSAVDAAAQYQLMVGVDADFATFPQQSLFTDFGPDTELTVPTALDADRDYFARVRAYNGAGAGPWSAVLTIRTGSGAPISATPFVTSPSQDAAVPTAMRIAWAGAPTVDLQVAPTAAFESPVFSRQSRTGFQENVGNLQTATAYFARVRAREGANTGAWSAPVRFETLPAPSVQRSIATGNPGPVTLDGVGIEVDFSDLQGSNPVIEAVQHATAPPGGFAVGGFTLQSASYWTLSMDGTDRFTTDVCFDLSAVSGVPGGAAALVVYKREAQGAPWVALTTELRPAGSPTQVCALGVTSFSDFVLASDDALPVELIGFDAVLSDGAVLLRWSTASETSNAGFAVERQATGAEGVGLWEEIGWKAGAGASVEAQHYTFTDEALPYEANTLRYRLRQVDYDGTVAYSPEVEVESEAPLTLALEANFPNPFGSTTTVRFAVPKAGDVRLVVYDVLGREVMTVVDEPKDAGRYALTLDARHLAAGVYLYRIEAGGRSVVRQMTVVR